MTGPSVIATIRKEDKMIGRDKEIRLLQVSYVAGEHVLLIGPPGTGKSMLVEEFARAGGFSYFRYLLTKFTSPDELFGPVSFAGLKNGSFERVLQGRAADSEVLFLDEVFKASSAILNSLLTLMQERVFFNPQPIKTPLRMVVGASNEVPQGEEAEALGALWDRFLIRHIVEPVSEDAWDILLDGGGRPISINRQDLDEAARARPFVDLPQDIKDLLKELRARLRTELGQVISDRRFVKSAGVVRAVAALDGRSEVEAQDLAILSNIWVQDLRDIKKVADFILSVIDPDAAEIERLRDAATEIVAAFQEATQDDDATTKIQAASQALAQLKDLKQRLQQFKSPSAKEVLQTVEAEQRKLMDILVG